MTERKKEQMVQNLKQLLIDDILQASDEEIVAQFSEDIGSPESNAAQMSALLEKAILLANKERLGVARAAIAANKLSKELSPIPIAEARERLRKALTELAHDKSFTLAARKESDLSDGDVLDMLEAMRELGLLK